MSPPNDEAFIGHPLSKMGLEGYQISKVENSPWIERVIDINSVHPYHNPKMYKDYNHYVIPFKESVFECLAKGYVIELIIGDMYDAFDVMKGKLFEQR